MLTAASCAQEQGGATTPPPAQCRAVGGAPHFSPNAQVGSKEQATPQPEAWGRSKQDGPLLAFSEGWACSVPSWQEQEEQEHSLCAL